MMSFSASLPIISLVLIGGILVVFPLSRKFMTVKVTHWLLAIYIGILLLAVAILPFISDEHILQGERVEEKDYEEASGNLYQSLDKGDLSHIDGKYLIKKISLDYSNSDLKIVSNRNESTPTVYIERKSSDDQKIEGFVYNLGVQILGFNFSDRIIPMEVNLSKDTMRLNYPEHQEIHMTLVKKDFPINQFTGQKKFDEYITHDDQVIYLRAPKNVKVHSDDSIFLQNVPAE